MTFIFLLGQLMIFNLMIRAYKNIYILISVIHYYYNLKFLMVIQSITICTKLGKVLVGR